MDISTTDAVLYVLAIVGAFGVGFSLAKVLDRLKYKTAVLDLDARTRRLNERERALERRQAYVEQLGELFGIPIPAAAAAAANAGSENAQA